LLSIILLSHAQIGLSTFYCAGCVESTHNGLLLDIDTSGTILAYNECDVEKCLDYEDKKCVVPSSSRHLGRLERRHSSVRPHNNDEVSINKRQDKRLEASRKYLDGEISRERFYELERRYEGRYTSSDSGAQATPSSGK
jgi:hypothetical protein